MEEEIQFLECCCCEQETKGRQWYNRDIGFGLCKRCVVFNHADIPIGQTAISFGIRGYHYDLSEEENRK